MEEKKKVNLYENTDQAVSAAIDKIVVELFNKEKETPGAQSVLLTGCSPLVGTTSTCIGLSIALANTKRRTLFVDCDVRKSIRYKKLNEETTLGLSDYLVQHGELSVPFENIVYRTNIENLSYIPCGTYLENSTRILCSEQMRDLIHMVKGMYDYVIFDFPSINIVPDAQSVFRHVDGIVLLAALGETRKSQIKEAKMKVADYGDKYYGMIINKIPDDVYRRNVRDYDYYFTDQKGEQKLTRKTAYKKQGRRAK